MRGDKSATCLLSVVVTQTMSGALEAMNWAGRRTVATVVHAVARGMSGIRAAAVRRHNMRIAPCPPKRRRSESNRRIEVLQTSALPLGYGAAQRYSLYGKDFQYLSRSRPPTSSKPLP